jgi:hypothetical protein
MVVHPMSQLTIYQALIGRTFTTVHEGHYFSYKISQETQVVIERVAVTFFAAFP